MTAHCSAAQGPDSQRAVVDPGGLEHSLRQPAVPGAPCAAAQPCGRSAAAQLARPHQASPASLRGKQHQLPAEQRLRGHEGPPRLVSGDSTANYPGF